MNDKRYFKTVITLSCGNIIKSDVTKEELLDETKVSPFVDITEYYEVNTAKTFYDSENYVDKFKHITINRNQITSIEFI